MPRPKDMKSTYPCVSYRKDSDKWIVRSRSKRHPLPIRTFDTKEEAEQYYIRWKNAIYSGERIVIDETMLLSEAIEKYIHQVSEPNCKEHTVTDYRAYANNHILPYFSGRTAVSITKDEVEEFKRYLTTKPKQNPTPSKKPKKTTEIKYLSSATINKILILLNATYEHLIDSEILKANPVKKVKLLTVNNKESDFLDIDDCRMLLKTAKEDITITPYGVVKGEYYLILLVAIITGIRQGELVSLTWDKVDFANKEFRIRTSYSHNTLSNSTKTRNGQRDLDIPDFVFDELKKYKQTQRNNPLNLVFPSHTGTYRQNLLRTLHRLLKKAGLKKVCWHALRHSNITALAEEGVSPVVSQRRAGHSGRAVTERIYTHISDRMSNQAKIALEVFNIDKPREVINND